MDLPLILSTIGIIIAIFFFIYAMRNVLHLKEKIN